jgi:NAD(P)-dependent dehydrogenase (short-subunit alcohol dehydrogenase family)
MQAVFITGANKGLGYEAALAIAKMDGYRVVLGCRDAARGAAASAAISAAVPDAVVDVIAGMDLLDPATLPVAAATLRTLLPDGVDVLVNNAAVRIADDSGATVAVNFTGHLAACDAFTPLVKRGGRIVNVSSRAAFLTRFPEGSPIPAALADPALSRAALVAHMAAFAAEACKDDGDLAAAGWIPDAYSVSKVGMNVFLGMQGRDAGLRERGVVATAVTPGYCQTDLTGNLGTRSAADGGADIAWLVTGSAGGDPASTGQFFGNRQPQDWTTAVIDM